MTKMYLFAAGLVFLAVVWTSAAEPAEWSVSARSWLGVGNFDTDDSVGAGATVEYIGWGPINLELSADWISFDTEDSLDVDMLPIGLTAKYYYWHEETFEPYVGFGTAWYILDVESPGNDEDDFGYHVTTGADIYLCPATSLVVEWKYQWLDADDLDFDGWSVYAGLRWYAQ